MSSSRKWDYLFIKVADTFAGPFLSQNRMSPHVRGNSEFRNPGKVSCGNWNPGLQNLELTAQGIRNNDNVYKQNPNSTDKECEIQSLGSGIHSLESRIHDCLG